MDGEGKLEMCNMISPSPPLPFHQFPNWIIIASHNTSTTLFEEQVEKNKILGLE
jgi:hypothetical protein